MNAITDKPVKFINQPSPDKLQPINYSAISKELLLPKNLLQRIVTNRKEYKVKTISYCNLEEIQKCFKKNLPPHLIENLSEIFKERPLGVTIKITDAMRAEIETAVYKIAMSRPACIRPGITINYNTLGEEMGFSRRRLEHIIGYEITGPSSQNQFLTPFELRKIQSLFRDYFCHDGLEKLHIFNLPDYNDDMEIEITPTLREEIKTHLNKIINVKRHQAKLRRVDRFSAPQQNLCEEIRSYKATATTTRPEENLSEREHAAYEQGTFFEEVRHLSKKAKTSSPYPLSTATQVPEFKFFALEEAFQ